MVSKWKFEFMGKYTKISFEDKTNKTVVAKL